MDIRNTKIRCGGEQSIVYLPEEIIEEILAKLELKSVLRFRCVSQSWRSLIDNYLKSSRRRVIFNAVSVVDDLYMCWPIDDPTNNHLKGGCVVGCCNGVLCILKQPMHERWRFFLWNPATGISIKLPKFRTFTLFSGWVGWYEIRCGFGWDEESDAYKLFVSVLDYDHWKIIGKVYSSKTNSWKTLDCRRLSLRKTPYRYNVGVLSCGKIYWLREKRYRYDDINYIEYFDLKSEVLGRIKLPARKPKDGVGRWWLRERDGCLYALYSYYNSDDYERSLYSYYNSDDYERSLYSYNNSDDYERRGGRKGGERRSSRRRQVEEADLLDVWVMDKESWVRKGIVTIPNSTFDYQHYVYVENLVSSI